MRSVLHYSFVKPLLNDIHKLERLKFVQSQLKITSDGNYRIKDMRNAVHIDEKWFYTTKVKRKVRQFPQEQRYPDLAVIRKSRIKKVMFLAAVGVPQIRPDGTWFDGKIGIWPIVERTTAKRGNRPAGAEVMKALSLTAEVYLDLMTREGGVIESIREKMYWLAESGVAVQHNGASQNEGKDNDFRLACAG